jgi:hypothetical protein
VDDSVEVEGDKKCARQAQNPHCEELKSQNPLNKGVAAPV